MNILYTHFRDNFFLIIISFMAFNQVPIVVRAEEYTYSPIEFIAPINAARGTLNPIEENGFYLTDKDACHLLTANMGWSSEGCKGVDKYLFSVTSEIDSIIFSKPVSEGYVKFDDWDNEDRDDEINEIWQQLVESAQIQGENLGIEIEAIRWHVYPTLDKVENAMYYATLINWEGEPTLNIKVTKFDRKGYVSFLMIPTNSNISPEQTTKLIHTVLPIYSSKGGQKYTEYIKGDKVAAVGVVGVLAALVGVKYGKGLAAGLLAMALLIAKKAWFLLLLPFFYLKKLFKGKKDDD